MPPYDLRHAYASLRIRAGASIPELAEELGHSPQMTVGTYTPTETANRPNGVGRPRHARDVADSARSICDRAAPPGRAPSTPRRASSEGEARRIASRTSGRATISRSRSRSRAQSRASASASRDSCVALASRAPPNAASTPAGSSGVRIADQPDGVSNTVPSSFRLHLCYWCSRRGDAGYSTLAAKAMPASSGDLSNSYARAAHGPTRLTQSFQSPATIGFHLHQALSYGRESWVRTASNQSNEPSAGTHCGKSCRLQTRLFMKWSSAENSLAALHSRPAAWSGTLPKWKPGWRNVDVRQRVQRRVDLRTQTYVNAEPGPSKCRVRNQQRHRRRDENRDMLSTSHPGVNDVRPLLHHVAPLRFVLGLVIDAAGRSPVLVRQTLLDPVAVEAHLVQERGPCPT